MSVSIRMLSVVVPAAKIDACFTEGGFAGYCTRFASAFGAFRWHDGRLLVSAHPDPEFVELEVRAWEEWGLATIEDGRWVDLCVVDQYGGPTLPCAWLEFDRSGGCAWLQGSERGDEVGPSDPRATDSAVYLAPEALAQAEAVPVRPRPWWKFWGS